MVFSVQNNKSPEATYKSTGRPKDSSEWSIGRRPKTFDIEGNRTLTKAKIVKTVQHITSKDHSILNGPPNLSPFVVHWATKNFPLFHSLGIDQISHSVSSTRRVNVSQDALTFLTHWGRVTHICVGKLTIIGSGNGLSPGRRQAIIWTNAGILLIEP